MEPRHRLAETAWAPIEHLAPGAIELDHSVAWAGEWQELPYQARIGEAARLETGGDVLEERQLGDVEPELEFSLPVSAAGSRPADGSGR